MDPTGTNAKPTRSGLSDRVVRSVPAIELSPLRITAIYAAFGLVALYVSDVLLVRQFSEPLLSQVQALKGGVEVLLTAGLIFALTSRSERQVRDANADLERQRDELRLLHRVLRHNLRNDLTAVRGYVQLVRDDITGEQIERRCDRVLEAAQEIERYTEQAQRIRKAADLKDRRKRVDLREVVRGILDANPHVTSDVETTTTLSGETTVRASPMIGEAIDELVTNAITHDPSDSPAITIEVATEPGSNWTTIRIVDDGPGVPESEMAALRAEESEPLSHLSGMGLWFVDWVVTHSDGDLQVSVADGGGTEVRLRLPNADAS